MMSIGGMVRMQFFASLSVMALAASPALSQSVTNPKIDITITALSKRDGISESAAEIRVKAMRKMSDAVRAIAQRFPDTFSYAVTEDHGQTFKIAMKGAANISSIDTIAPLISGLNIVFVEATLSETERKQITKNLFSRLKKANIDAAIETDDATGKMKILAKHPDEVRAAIKNGTIAVPEGTLIVQSDGIILTTINWPGGTSITGLAELAAHTVLLQWILI